MSRETLAFLNANTLIGFTDKRGQACHYRESLQGDEPNYYVGAIPVEDVRRRLFGWEPIEAMSAAIVMTGDGVQTIVDDTRKQIVHPETGAVLGVFKAATRCTATTSGSCRTSKRSLTTTNCRLVRPACCAVAPRAGCRSRPTRRRASKAWSTARS